MYRVFKKEKVDEKKYHRLVTMLIAIAIVFVSVCLINATEREIIVGDDDEIITIEESTHTLTYCDERLAYLNIPDDVVVIGEGACMDCKNLKNVSIPNGIKSIETEAFFGCDGLVNIVIPNSVTKIGWGAFESCDNLTSVVIPSSVTNIEEYAFGFCDNLTLHIYANSYAEKYAKKNKVRYVVEEKDDNIDYSITYKRMDKAENNSNNPGSFNSDTSTIILENPYRWGYKFKGWYSSSSYKRKITKIKKGTAKDIVLYAKWEPNKYSIVFNANGGKGSMKKLKNKKYDTRFKLPKNKFKRNNYKFIGWTKNKEGTGTLYPDRASVRNLSTKGTVTLYAKWE